MNKLAFQYGMEKYCKERGLDADDVAVLIKMAEKVGFDKLAFDVPTVEDTARTGGSFIPPVRAATTALDVGIEGANQIDRRNRFLGQWKSTDDAQKRGLMSRNEALRLRQAQTQEERMKIMQENNGLAGSSIGATGYHGQSNPTESVSQAQGSSGPTGQSGQSGAPTGRQSGFGPNADNPDDVIAQYQQKFGPYARKQNQGSVAMKFLELSDQMGLDPNDPASAPLALERFRSRYGDTALTNLQNAARQNKQWFQGYIDPSSAQLPKPTGRAPRLMAGGAGGQQPQAPQSRPASPAAVSTPPASGNYVPPQPPASNQLNAGDPGFSGYDAPVATPQTKGPKLSGQTSFGKPTLTSAALAQQGNNAANPAGGQVATPAVKGPGLKNTLNNDAIGRQLMTGKPAWVNGQRIDPSSPEAAQYKAVFENSPSGKIHQQNQQSTGWRAASQQIVDNNARARESGDNVKQPGIYADTSGPNVTGSLRNLDMDRTADKGNYRPTGKLPSVTGKPPVDTAAAKAMASGQPAFTPATPAAPVTAQGGGDLLSKALNGGIASTKKPKPVSKAYVDPETGNPPLVE